MMRAKKLVLHFWGDGRIIFLASHTLDVLSIPLAIGTCFC
jgi:hypothetical protein